MTGPNQPFSQVTQGKMRNLLTRGKLGLVSGRTLRPLYRPTPLDLPAFQPPFGMPGSYLLDTIHSLYCERFGAEADYQIMFLLCRDNSLFGAGSVRGVA